MSLVIAKEIWESFSEQKKQKLTSIAKKYGSEINVFKDMKCIGYDHTIHMMRGDGDEKDWERFCDEMGKALSEEVD